MTRELLRRRVLMCGLFAIGFLGLASACSEQAVDPTSPHLFNVRLNHHAGDPHELDTVTVYDCGPGYTGEYPNCYPDPDTCDPNYDAWCNPTDPCESDPTAPGCQDPCSVDPNASGCPCGYDPYPACDDPGEGENPPPPPPPERDQGCSSYQAYGPPMGWGSWYPIRDHIGNMTWRVDASAVGDTQLFSKVKYYGGTGWAEKQFGGSTIIVTGNAVATISAQFYGNPYGTAVNGLICALG